MLGSSLILLPHTVLWNWITKNQRTAQHWSFEFEPLRFRVGSLTSSLIFVENCGCRSKTQDWFLLPVRGSIVHYMPQLPTGSIFLSLHHFDSLSITTDDKSCRNNYFFQLEFAMWGWPQSLHNSTSQALTKMESYESWKSCESNCDWLQVMRSERVVNQIVTGYIDSWHLSIFQYNKIYVFFKVLYKVPMYHKPLTTNI